jgi:hypothetical protein
MSEALKGMQAAMEQLRAEEARKAADLQAAYDRLVVDVVDGLKIDPKEALAVVQAASKTYDNFQAAVRQLEQVKAYRDKLVEEPELREKLADVKRRSEEFMERRRKIEGELASEGAKLATEQRGIDDQLSGVHSARIALNDWESKQTDAFKALSQPAPVGGAILFRSNVNHSAQTADELQAERVQRTKAFMEEARVAGEAREGQQTITV